MSALALNRFYLSIEKRNNEEQIVEGVISSEAIDSDGESISYDALKEAADDYMRFANLREMHDPKTAAGKVLKFICDDASRTVRIIAKVVDKDAWQKVKEEVYKGFSIGGRALERIGNKITKLLLKEISLVDRPANPDAHIEVYKADKGDEFNKGMWQLSRLADTYSNLETILSDIVYREEMDDEDPSELRKLLEAARKKLGEAVVRMSELEVKELKGRKIARAEKGDAMAKVKRDEMEARFKKAMDACYKSADEEMEEDEVTKSISGALTTPSMSVPTQKADAGNDLSKVAAALESINKRMGGESAKAEDGSELNKAVSGMVSTMEAMAAKIEELSKSVKPAKAAVTAPLTKVDDSKPATDKPAAPDLNDPEVLKGMKSGEIMKAIHKNGGEPLNPALR